VCALFIIGQDGDKVTNLTINDALMVYINIMHFRRSLLNPNSDIRTILKVELKRNQNRTDYQHGTYFIPCQ